ncbi:DUF6352 family protein [Geminicoccaceae bacterium 1502E]|nr:DUF6352 family protein [Geminicoccaceae bacterium 1502E]
MSGDFWLESGWQLLGRDGAGRHLPSDAWLRSWLRRPELEPVEGSCAAERALHAALLDQPRRPVTPVTLLRLRDPDARENWELFTVFRDHLVAHGTLEDAYLALFSGGPVPFPALFLDRLVQAILRGLLDGCTDGLRLRAAECLYRPQRASLVEGGVLLADADTVDRHAAGGTASALERLVTANGHALRQIELDVLREETGSTYFARSENFDLVLDVSLTSPGLDALCRVLEAWTRHMLQLDLRVQPVASIRDERWRWHLGLDAEATRLLNELWNGSELPGSRLRQILALFRLEVRDRSLLAAGFEDGPLWAGLAMDAGGRVRLKPQNLLVNLPLATAAPEGAER